MNCLNRANICTSTTIGADIRIDLIDITLRYCFNRTLVNASSASCAIVADFVSHLYYFLVKVITCNDANLSKKIKIKKSDPLLSFQHSWLLEIEAEGKIKHFGKQIVVFDSPCPVGSYEISKDLCSCACPKSGYNWLPV